MNKKYTVEYLLEEIKKEYKRTKITPNSRNFHIHQNTYRHYFGSWNKALVLAGVPIRTRNRRQIECKFCNKKIDAKNSKSKFCSQSCSASYNNRKRPKRKKKEKKKQLTPFQKWKMNISGPYTKVHFRKCRHCGTLFSSFNKRWYCNEHRDLYSTPERDRYRFQFNVFTYPELFDLDLISSVGWYDGTSQTTDRLTRDHKVSVYEAIRNNYDPFYITHPLNCEIMSWQDNYNKRANSSMSYKELVQIVDKFLENQNGT